MTARIRPAWANTLVLPEPEYHPPSSRGTGDAPRYALASGLRTQRLRYQRGRPPCRSTPCTMPSPANQWYVSSWAANGFGPVRMYLPARSGGTAPVTSRSVAVTSVATGAKLPSRYFAAVIVCSLPRAAEPTPPLDTLAPRGVNRSEPRILSAWAGRVPVGRVGHTAGVSDPLRSLLAAPPDLPVTAGLAALDEALRSRGVAVVHAPPGTGKTTLVPPAVADVVAGRVVVTQPSRIAARAAARRLAHLLGEPVGETVGYSVRGDRRTSRRTRVEVVTTGLLLRRIQHDPELAGVGAVVLDEVHERHLDADLTLALLIDVRANLRDDLSLVAMSATVEAERTAALLGARRRACPGDPRAGCPAPGPDGLVPAAARGCAVPTTGGSPRPSTTTSPRPCAGRSPSTRATSWSSCRASRRSRRPYVASAGVDADVHALHGRLSAAEQDRALGENRGGEGPRRRVVVSTAVAESSLTVPGVRVVVDAGFSREPRTDHRRGLASLVTVAVSRAAAEQRAGRAGRLGPGAVLRCWSEAEHAHLAAHPEPEIATADLTAFALEVACWGSRDVRDLALLDQPPAHALAAAREVLVELGAMTEDGQRHPTGPADRRGAGRPPAGAGPDRRRRPRRGQAGRRGGRDAQRGRARSRRRPRGSAPVAARRASGPGRGAPR